MQFYDTGEVELYNLKDDVSETKNIIAENMDIAADLMKKLNAWRKDVGAVVPAR